MSRILGAHNTMSYLPAKKWWQKPFLWIAKCQSRSPEALLEDGVRCFDFRLKRDGGKFIFAHGMVDFNLKKDVQDFLTGFIQAAGKYGQCWFRFTLESSGADEKAEEAFRETCGRLEKLARENGCVCFGGTRKFDWKIIYEFSENPPYVQYVGSMQSVYGKAWPWLWAKLNNGKCLEESANEEKIVLFDFL